ncbi:hypothetical protein OEIGOIKO_07656 [Streptomyces chrestomyceticus JCM 4735]|uniref:Uncharacterized protein n=1 Tax=Streptomyces chrestomyceticus JCM 4735 TaxID=1306181 RepID=A0A7U9Q2D6_9ACTN|nr:hypothetical protein OEIGOIKO_07656 [Streptomyces chrestomyceticus JCM 4735]
MRQGNGTPWQVPLLPQECVSGSYGCTVLQYEASLTLGSAAPEKNLASGQHAEATAQGPEKASDAIKCRVAGEQRYAL